MIEATSNNGKLHYYCGVTGSPECLIENPELDSILPVACLNPALISRDHCSLPPG